MHHRLARVSGAVRRSAPDRHPCAPLAGRVTTRFSSSPARCPARRFAASRWHHRHNTPPGVHSTGASATLRDDLNSMAGFCTEQDTTIVLYRLSRPGGVHRSDRSGVGCSHTEGCPLFPLLRASLRGWRDYYCDHEDRWRDCARYKLSLTGRLVPITLLPNGKDAQLLRFAPDADRSGAAEPRPAPRQALPSRLNSGSPRTAVPRARFEPAPGRPLEPSPASPVPPPEPGPTPAAARPFEPSPPPAVPQPPERPAARSKRPSRRAPGSIRRWWTRLSEWMTGPA